MKEAWNTHTVPYQNAVPGDGGPQVYSYTFEEPVSLKWLEASIPAQLFPAPDGSWIGAQWDGDWDVWTVWTNETAE